MYFIKLQCLLLMYTVYGTKCSMESKMVIDSLHNITCNPVENKGRPTFHRMFHFCRKMLQNSTETRPVVTYVGLFC